jgi:hypothetical protein
MSTTSRQTKHGSEEKYISATERWPDVYHVDIDCGHIPEEYEPLSTAPHIPSIRPCCFCSQHDLKQALLEADADEWP